MPDTYPSSSRTRLIRLRTWLISPLTWLRSPLTWLSSPRTWLSGVCACLALCTALIASPLMAQGGGYGVDVAVADRSDAEQRAAYVAGMRQVLLNSSGDKTLLNRNAVREGLRKAENYVESVSYRTPAAGTVLGPDVPITPKVRQSGEATQLARVHFDRLRIRELIDSSAEPVDEDDSKVVENPLEDFRSALVWMLIIDGDREIRGSDPAAIKVRQRASEIAGAAGITLVYPEDDEIDLAALTNEDLQARTLERIRLASERYREPVILLGTLQRNGGRGWQANWQRVAGEQVDDTVIDSTSLDVALQDGIGWLVPDGSGDTSYRYGGGGTSDAEGLVWISSLNSTASYATVMKFLSGVAGVSTVYPKEVSEAGMVFAVIPRAALPAVNTAAAAQNWLRRTATPVDAMGSELGRNAELALDYLQ